MKAEFRNRWKNNKYKEIYILGFDAHRYELGGFRLMVDILNFCVTLTFGYEQDAYHIKWSKCALFGYNDWHGGKKKLNLYRSKD